MWTGVQFTASIAPNSSHRWFTWGWPASWHVVWYLMPTAGPAGGPQVEWTIGVERSNSSQCTYWINVRNLTGSTVTFEGRYAVLSG